MKIRESIIESALRHGKISSLALYGLLQLFSGEAYAASISTKEDVVKVLCNIAAYMFWILIALSTIMVIVAAYLYLTGGDNAENVKKAHKTIAYAAVGIVVALLAKGFPNIIASVVGATIPSSSTCP